MARADQLAENSLKEAMAELSKKLGLFERVRHVCQSVAIPLPGVVVVGEQSAGKSSLLENISGIQFPRAQNTCTRMPCVLTLLTDPTVEESFAEVSMDSSFTDAESCSVPDVEEKSSSSPRSMRLTTSSSQARRRALYVRVVRKEGPQLSLIDLPGVTHNADQMHDIHEVTVSLVEEYIKPEEMVILCVIPAMSDFGNAEVVKLARKYDPDGIRTLGVVTKCDDAANAEHSDVVEKVLMTRSSDVRLELGFHCVVNRSQKNINDGMGREELWAKEKSIFTKNDRMKRLPEKNWGTLRLMEKVAKIQEARVDECLPKIKEAVRKRTVELREELRRLPAQAETEADQFRLFNSILTKIRGDLARRIRAEFMSAEASDRELTIAPIVASKVQKFRQQLVARNPDWLGQDMIDSVTDSVQTFVQGYTVDNLTGPHVFINLIKQIFVEEGLLKDSVHELVMDVGEHLRKVVEHVIGVHGDINGVLSNRLDAKAEECIDRLTCEARDMCEMLAEAQQVTSTTHGDYMVQLTRFRKSWLHEAFEDDAEEQEETGKDAEEEEEGEQTNEGQNKLPAEFLSLVKDSKEEPQKLTVLEICASLHVYTKLMIEGFAEMSAKLIKFNMVEQLADKLEEIWREELGGSNLHELFPRDGPMVQQQEDLKRKISILSEFKDQLMSLRTAPVRRKRKAECFGRCEEQMKSLRTTVLPKGKRTISDKAQARADAKAEEAAAAAKTQESESKPLASEVAAKKPARYVWNFAKDIEGKTFKTGENIFSGKFTLLGVPDLQLQLCPQGHWKATKGQMSLFLDAPKGWQITYNVTLGDVVRKIQLHTFESDETWGWPNFAPSNAASTELAVELLEAVPPTSNAA